MIRQLSATIDYRDAAVGLAGRLRGPVAAVDRYLRLLGASAADDLSRSEPAASAAPLRLDVVLEDTHGAPPADAIDIDGGKAAGSAVYRRVSGEWHCLELLEDGHWRLTRPAEASALCWERPLMRLGCLRAGGLPLHASVGACDGVAVAAVGAAGAGKTAVLLAMLQRSGRWVGDDECFCEPDLRTACSRQATIEVKQRYLAEMGGWTFSRSAGGSGDPRPANADRHGAPTADVLCSTTLPSGGPPANAERHGARTLKSLLGRSQRWRLACAGGVRRLAGVCRRLPLPASARRRLKKVAEGQSTAVISPPGRIASAEIGVAILVACGDRPRLEPLDCRQWAAQAACVLWDDLQELHQLHRRLCGATGAPPMWGEAEDRRLLEDRVAEFAAGKQTYLLVRRPCSAVAEVRRLLEPIWARTAHD